MNILLTSEQMRSADLYTQNSIGIDGMVLMERAAFSVCSVVRSETGRGRKILCVCGNGNNGGDGIAVARILRLEGFQADVFLCSDPQDKQSFSDQCRRQLEIFERLDGFILKTPDFSGYDVIVDALFGIGLNREVTGSYADLIRKINESGKKVIAVDIPSGIGADHGSVLGCAVKASVTVTFQFFKPGHLLYPGKSYCGKTVVENIGIVKPDAIAASAFFLEKKDLPCVLPERIPRSNKGSYGKLLLIAGKSCMAGACILSARAALKTGCGMVKILSPEENRIILQSCVPEALYEPLPGEEEMERLRRVIERGLNWSDAAAIGPGIGTDQDARAWVRTFFSLCDKPMVVDADALNIISSENAEIPFFRPGKTDEKHCPPVITPHPGEMARLTGLGIKEVLDRPDENAGTFAREHNLVCVLKDAATVVSNGDQLYINTSGCDGMATAGSGDVLTGIIGSLLAQRPQPFQMAALGVFLHGLAGQKAQEKNGARSMTAGDIADHISGVLKDASGTPLNYKGESNKGERR